MFQNGKRTIYCLQMHKCVNIFLFPSFSYIFLKFLYKNRPCIINHPWLSGSLLIHFVTVMRNLLFIYFIGVRGVKSFPLLLSRLFYQHEDLGKIPFVSLISSCLVCIIFLSFTISCCFCVISSRTCMLLFQQKLQSGPRTPIASPPHSPISPAILPQRAPAISDPSVSTTRVSNAVSGSSEQLTPKQQKMRDHFKTKVNKLFNKHYEPFDFHSCLSLYTSFFLYQIVSQFRLLQVFQYFLRFLQIILLI